MPNEKELIQTLANQIAKGQGIDDWKYYLALLVLIAIAAAVGTLLVSFFREKGRLIASNAEFTTILAQLKATTEQTANITTRISHDDWTKKEINTLWRTKLEDLLGAILRFQADFLEDINVSSLRKVSRSMKSSISITEAEKIILLYFPQLRDELRKYLGKC